MSAIFSIHRPRRVARLAGGIAVSLVLAAGALGLAGGSSAATPPTQDGAVAAGYAGGWLAAQVTADGSVHNVSDDPSPGATLLTALGLATAGTEQATFTRTVGWLRDHVDAVTGTGATADPGQLGYLLLVVDAAGADATSFGGVNLVTRLGGTLGQFEPGLYGQADPTYDGAFRQSLAILGLAAVGAPQGTGSVAWLTAQQCGGVDAAIQGGWESYRAPATACTAPDPNLFTGPDTNSTAIAAEALAAVGVTPGADALGWLDRAQNSSGGWGFLPGLDDDPNSTALVVQAIVASGQSPTTGQWVEGTNTALSAVCWPSNWAATPPSPTAAPSPSRAPTTPPTPSPPNKGCGGPRSGPSRWGRSPSEPRPTPVHRGRPPRPPPRPRLRSCRPPRRWRPRRPSRAERRAVRGVTWRAGPATGLAPWLA